MDASNFGLVINQVQAANINSDSINLGPGFDGMNIQTEWGTITGTLKLQSRNHEAMEWRDVTDANTALTQPTGTAGGQSLDVGNVRGAFYRIVYTHSSGTGALKVAVFAKGS
jgi:hypothetical protein